MNSYITPIHRRHTRRKQAGSAILVFFLVIGIGLLALLVSSLTNRAAQNEADQATQAALAEAKAALIGWSSMRGDNGATYARPGELPCPSTAAPGTALYGYDTGTCAAGAIGRLPWRTLGIPELRDSAGEPLWYAVSGAFRERTAVQNTAPLNSDTRGTLLVFAANGATLLTPNGEEAAAIIFSPGSALPGQLRGTPAQQVAVANYLESVAPPVVLTARNNRTVGGPFINGPIKNASGNVVLNDVLMVLSARELLQNAQRRVASEVVSMLSAVAAANGGKFPNPANPALPGCMATGATAVNQSCPPDPTRCRGRLPKEPFTPLWYNTPTAVPPPWFNYNVWSQTIYYSVGSASIQNNAGGCAPSLTLVDASGNSSVAKGLIFLPGSPRGATIRPTAALSDYLSDPENQDGWGASPNDLYVTSTRQDQLVRKLN
jgi:hypothetical protein